jgi:hypothetical protein
MIYGLTRINWFLWGLLRDHARDPDRQLKELIWHYTNKQVPGMKFYQPSHENIIVFFADATRRTFNQDDLRQPYESNYARSAGRVRCGTPGRFGSKPSIYKPHGKGATPRDVLAINEVPPVLEGGILKTGTLAGGSGRERVIGPDGKRHPTQKPVKLTRWLILGSSNPGDSILIPFAGSGTEAFVAYEQKRNFLGFELNWTYVEMAQARFEAAGFATEYVELNGTRAWKVLRGDECFQEGDVHPDSKCRARQTAPIRYSYDREPVDRGASPCSRTAVGVSQGGN